MLDANLNISPPLYWLIQMDFCLLESMSHLLSIFFVCVCLKLKTSCLGNTAAASHPTEGRPYFLKIKDIFHILWLTPNAFKTFVTSLNFANFALGKWCHRIPASSVKVRYEIVLNAIYTFPWLEATSIIIVYTKRDFSLRLELLPICQ